MSAGCQFLSRLIVTIPTRPTITCDQCWTSPEGRMSMATLGKCLLFYLKYPVEVDRLYEADEPNVEGLPNPEQVLERVRRVADAANREAAQLLEACAQPM